MNIRSLLLTLAAAALFLSGCGNVFKGKDESEKQIPVFHSLYDAEKFSDIYAAADKEFTAKTPEPKLKEFLGAVHRKLGTVKSTSGKGWKVNNWNGTTYVVLTQETVFEKGKGTETFTYIMRDGKPVLGGYNINSEDLILN